MSERSSRIGSIAASVMMALFLCVAAPSSAAAQLVSSSGTFHVLRGDPPPESGLAPFVKYFLREDSGQLTELELDASALRSVGGALAIDGQRVTISGQRGTTFTAGRYAALQVDSLEAIKDLPVLPFIPGAHPWVTILCRFADYTTVTPRDPSWVQGLMGSAYPGMDHYFRELSFNKMNLFGSIVVGWYNLPGTRADYLAAGGFQKVAEDCTAAADPYVDFTKFYGINLFFNVELDGAAYGAGAWPMTLEGETSTYGMTWLGPGFGYGHQAVLAQEMGHGFGLPHSTGPYPNNNGSYWDVQSVALGMCDWTMPPYPYGCIGVHTNAYHKDRLGWIPASLKRVVPSGTEDWIALQPLAQKTDDVTPLMVQIPIGGSTTQFYTVEARQFLGYDSGLPGEAVIIHRVDTDLEDLQSKVVSVGYYGSHGEGAGAMWTVGEEYVDWDNNIAIAVMAGPPGWPFVVRVANNLPDLIISALSAPNAAGPGRTISVTDSTLNQRGITAGATTTTQFYLSPDSILGGGDVVLGSRAVGPLAPGAASSASTALLIPATTAYGNYYLIAKADATGNVPEMQEGNNVRAVPLAITPPADLAVTMTDSPDPAWGGDIVTYTIRVTNHGPAVATGVTLIDNLSVNSTFVSATSSRGSCSRLLRRVTCTLGTFQDGAIATVIITVVATTPGKVITNPWSMSNSASVTSGQADPIGSNNTATAVTKVYE